MLMRKISAIDVAKAFLVRKRSRVHMALSKMAARNFLLLIEGNPPEK
jgi:hypothetical protein